LIHKKYLAFYNNIVVHLKIHHTLAILSKEYYLDEYNECISCEYPKMIPDLLTIEQHESHLYEDNEYEYPLVGDRPIEKPHKITISECELISYEMHICIDMWFMVDRSEISDIIH
jgi:hypothetical protein